MAINARWHRKNPMPWAAKMDERIRWHVAHAKACACRPIPASIAEAIRKQGGRAAPRRQAKRKRPGLRTSPGSHRRRSRSM
jgi:hypothetical protein